MSVFRVRVFSLGLFAIALGSGFASVAQNTSVWITAEGGSWHTATNWSPVGVPNSSTVLVDFASLALPADMTVGITNNVSVAGFRFGDTDATPNAITIDSGADNFRIILGPAASEVQIHAVNGQATILNRILFTTSSSTRKTGNGTVSFGYSGNVYGTNGLILEEGTVAYASNSPTIFNNRPIVFQGGTLLFPFGASGLSLGGQVFTVNPAGGTLIITNGTVDYRPNATDILRGSGTLVVRGGGAFFFPFSQNSFSGTLSVREGSTLRLGLVGEWQMTNGIVHLSEGSRLRLQGAITSRIARLTGTGEVNMVTANPVLMVGDDGPAPFYFEYFGTNNSGVSLIKTGMSTMVWSGTNAYFGTTTIGQGTMIANGQHSGSVGSYTVNDTGILGGTGRITRTVTANGAIAPGYGGIGTLTVSNMVWNEGVSWLFQLGTPGLADRLACLGSFQKGSGMDFVFDFQNTGAAGVYTLVTWAASTTFVSTDLLASNLPSGLTPLFSTNANALILTLTGGGGSPLLGVSPSSLDFGGFEVGASTSLVFAVTNIGSGLLTGTVVVTGGAPFSITAGASYSLAAGESTNVVVQFAPSSPGTFGDGVFFASDGGSIAGTLSGVGYLIVAATNSSVFVSNGLVGFQFSLASGGLYRVQATTNLLSGASWQDVSMPLTNWSGPSVLFTDTNSMALPNRAYRIQSP